MVLKELGKIWKKESTLDRALKEIQKMLSEDRLMFETAINGLFENKKMHADVYKMDQKVNRYEVDMRKKILTHLVVNPKQDLTTFLILLGVTRSIERIGDYCKNIADLKRMHPEKLINGKYVAELIKARDDVLESFNMTVDAFENSDKAKAKKVIEIHKKAVNPVLKKLRGNIIKDSKMNVRKAVVYVLLARYLRRVSAHLANISSTVVNPFHKVSHFT